MTDAAATSFAAACRHRVALSVRSGCVGSPLVSSGTSRRDGMERALAATADALAGGGSDNITIIVGRPVRKHSQA